MYEYNMGVHALINHTYNEPLTQKQVNIIHTHKYVLVFVLISLILDIF